MKLLFVSGIDSERLGEGSVFERDSESDDEEETEADEDDDTDADWVSESVEDGDDVSEVEWDSETEDVEDTDSVIDSDAVLKKQSPRRITDVFRSQAEQSDALSPCQANRHEH